METQRTERILNSLDGLQKARAHDFFYTRLKGRLQRKTEVSKPFLLLRPAFITAALSVVLIINIFSLTQFKEQSEQKVNNANIESFAEAYGMRSASVYE